jgi:hypothetical protein
MAKKSGKSESSYTYFKELLKSNPELLRQKKNAPILERYRADHGLPEGADVEQKVINNLSNLKSTLRKEMPAKRGRPKGAVTTAKPAARNPAPKLQALEVSIDDCLSAARSLDPKGLEEVIGLLHRARNMVICKIG